MLPFFLFEVIAFIQEDLSKAGCEGKRNITLKQQSLSLVLVSASF